MREGGHTANAARKQTKELNLKPIPALQLELELEGVRNQLQDANTVQLQVTTRATTAEERIRVIS